MKSISFIVFLHVLSFCKAKTKSGTFLTESCGGAMCTPRMMERILQHYKIDADFALVEGAVLAGQN